MTSVKRLTRLTAPLVALTISGPWLGAQLFAQEKSVTSSGLSLPHTQKLQLRPIQPIPNLTLPQKPDAPPAGEPYNPYGVKVDPSNEVRSAVISDRKMELVREEKIRIDSFFKDIPDKPKEDFAKPSEPDVISPILREWLNTKKPDELVEVIVVLAENMQIPLLPELQEGESRDETTQRSRAIDELKDMRFKKQEAAASRLYDAGGFKWEHRFWLVNALQGRMLLGDVKKLAELDEVRYIQPVHGGEKPPADANNNNDAEDGRDLIDSDPYYNLGLTAPWIGLLDTGVRESHQMFKNPDHIAWMRDCVNGDAKCRDNGIAGFDPSDFSWNHGTSSAGIITGNNRLGNAFRGATEVRLDSWQIYTAGGLNSAAAVRAHQAAVAAFDKVIVGEIQAGESDTGAIALAADAAYDAGAIIIAANGNYGPNAKTVASPGIAHKVIGVGGFMTDGGAQYNGQGRGPAPDNRYKPDIQAPTWSETASNASDNALRVFSGTSGATPYAASAAMLARNWLHKMGTVDNGQVYAFMILYGQDPYPYDNTVGAGPIEMATNGHAWWSKLTVAHHQTIEIAINVPANRSDFDAALWWPESQAQSHNDIDVHLIDPNGNEQARGYSGPSVFERAAVAGALMPGTWKIRIRGYSVPTGSQVIYMAAHIRG